MFVESVADGYRIGGVASGTICLNDLGTHTRQLRFERGRLQDRGRQRLIPLRGEHWSLTNEVGRIVALGYLGEINQARRDLVGGASLLSGERLNGISGERLNGIDGDLLIAAAMLRLYDNDLEGASVLLGAVNATRTHATICLYMEAFERIDGPT